MTGILEESQTEQIECKRKTQKHSFHILKLAQLSE